MIDLQNRIEKRFKHLTKWANRQGISCFRVYEKDLPDYPLILDWYDGDAVLWIYARTCDDSLEQKEAFLQQSLTAICKALALPAKAVFIKGRKIQKGIKSQYQKIGRDAATKVIKEGGLQFELNMSDYLDVGLFLDHRKTRHMIRNMAQGKRVLNLFAYTGTFSCYALDGGAKHVSSVELNPNYCHWIDRNILQNKMQNHHRCIRENCLSFLKQETSRSRYDLIICDPPTFSQSKRMKKGCFSINEDYAELLSDCLALLSREGHILFSSNSKRFKLNPDKINESIHVQSITTQTQSVDFKRYPGHQAWLIQHE